MCEEEKDGGSAFPYTTKHREGPPVIPGMSLRDWFAGMVLPAVVGRYPFDIGEFRAIPVNQNHCHTLADTCYTLADAMLKERGE